MGDSGHHRHDAGQVRCAVVVVSDTRNDKTDRAGKLIRERLDDAGHRVTGLVIVADEQPAIAEAVRKGAEGAEAVIITGGTGITPRDVTPEAVLPLLDKILPGFGETLRRISFDQVGAHALLSRAFAGCMGSCLVFALPGSPKACATAMDEVLLPMLAHGVAMASGPQRIGG